MKEIHEIEVDRFELRYLLNGEKFGLDFKFYPEEPNSHTLKKFKRMIGLQLQEKHLSFLKPEYLPISHFEIKNDINNSFKFAEWCLSHVFAMPDNRPGKLVAYTEVYDSSVFVPDMQGVYRLYLLELRKTLRDLPL